MTALSDKIAEVESECWIWSGYIQSNGYGQLTKKGKTYKAHRLIYEAVKGPIPNGLQIDHLCRNRACVNPKHLEAVTQRENILRGEGLSAKNARKKTCKNGHNFSGFQSKNNKSRKCQICHRAAYKRHYARNSKNILAKQREEYRLNKLSKFAGNEGGG